MLESRVVTVKSELGLEFSLSFSCLSYVCGMQCWHHAYLTTHEEEAASETRCFSYS